MKRFFLLAAAFVTGFAVMAQKPDEVIKLNADTYNFGKIKKGIPVTTFFTVTNISDKPVLLENVVPSCGCTTPEWSKEPIAPGSSAQIKVGYNAANPMPFTKDVTIRLAGIQEAKIIHITGEVLTEDAFDAYTKTDEYKKAEAAKTKESKGDSKDKKTSGFYKKFGTDTDANNGVKAKETSRVSRKQKTSTK